MSPQADEDEPVYLELVDALELYAAIIDGTSAQAADQLRDRPGLEGALDRPRNYALYQEADLVLQAAALAHGIAESQTFVDGNSASRSLRCSSSSKSTAFRSRPRIQNSHRGSSVSLPARHPNNSLS